MKALAQIGGYNSIPFSITEDAALVSQMRKACKQNKISAACTKGSVITTAPEDTWKSFFNQALRWHNGGIFSPEIVTRINYNFLMIIISIGIIAIPFIPLVDFLWVIPVSVFLGMIINTLMLLFLYHKDMPKFGFASPFLYSFFIVFAPFFFTILTIMGYLKIKVKWKDHAF
jgi:cellulose synthase/poly-beta-1,6-N-acetylglucosamine synthase-like glycosyltransferase